MAAAADHTHGLGNSPQEILSEVRNFLGGISHEGKVSSENLAKSALFLLRTLPAARQAVLEHLCNVFDETVNAHLLRLEFGQGATDDSGPVLDSTIQDACGVLLNFIKTNPAAWAPIISAWSLELLGYISSKYAERRGVPQGSLNELLQLWMTCKPTKLLMEVATECFAAMVTSAPDVCVDGLLEASVKYTPHFDWVVAHIGSCFPTTIITRVLMCGLKDFSHHGKRPQDVDMRSQEKIPKMASVVGILGHLTSKHGQDIRNALMRLFEESLQSDSEAVKTTTVPFLLQLSSMSPMLLQVLTTDLVKALTPSVLNKLQQHFSQWRLHSSQEYDSLLNLVVHLVMKSDTGACEVLVFLIFNAAPPAGVGGELPVEDVQQTCASLINQLILELHKSVFSRHGDMRIEVPFLAALTAKASNLTEMLLSSEGKRAEWMQKLLSYVALYGGIGCGTETLAFIVTEATQPPQLCHFLHLQASIEVGFSNILPNTVVKLLDMLQPHRNTDKPRLLQNLLSLVKWERASTVAKQNRSGLSQCLQSRVTSLLPLLSHSDLDVAMTTLKILNIVELPKCLGSSDVLHVCGNLVSLVFRVLELAENKKVLKMVHSCRQCVKQLCRHTYTQCILIRFLMEGVLNQDSAALFGSRVDTLVSSDVQKQQTSLYEDNRKHGLSLTLPRSHSSVFHAGIIGQGLKQRSQYSPLLKEHISRNRQCLLEILWLCAQQPQQKNVQSESDIVMETEPSSPEKKYKGLKISPDMCRVIGNLLTELTTPDVLYNNRFWPEEESLRVTVERDLHVLKIFEDNPVLWDITEMYAKNSLVMCRCSPVLKCLTATLMNHFEASREKSTRNSPKQLEAAFTLVRCLAKSRLLPQPLCLVSELFPHVTPYETYLLLLAVWRYMKENPPTEDPDEVTRRVCEPRHLEVVRSVFHSNIDKMRHLYARFFGNGESVSLIIDDS